MVVNHAAVLSTIKFFVFMVDNHRCVCYIWFTVLTVMVINQLEGVEIMLDAVAAAAAEMAAAYDIDAVARGFILGAEATIRELSRMGVLPEEKKEADKQ